jgi:hypothetical protein
MNAPVEDQKPKTVQEIRSARMQYFASLQKK